MRRVLQMAPFSVVGVTQRRESFPWSCAKCESANGVQETRSTSAPLLGSGGPSGQPSKSHSNMPSVPPQAQLQYQHEQQSYQQHPQHQLQQRHNVSASQLALSFSEEKSHQPEGSKQAPFVTSLQWIVSPTRQGSAAASESSSRSSQAVAKLKLQMLEEMRNVERRETERQRAIAAEDAKREKAFLEQKYQLLEQAMSESGSSKNDFMTRTQNWIATTNAHCGEQITSLAEGQVNSDMFGGKMQVWNPAATRIGSTRSSLPEPNPPDPFPVPESLLSCPVDPPALSAGIQRLNLASVNQAPLPIQCRPILSADPSRRVSLAQLPHSSGHGVAASIASQQIEERPSRRFSHNAPVPEHRQFIPHSSQPTANQQLRPHSSTMREHRFYDQDGEEECDPYPITRKQLAARQAVSKDLPTFSGDPEEWPLFLSTFNSTTALCGFTNDENIVRLQRSLKGRAYEAVKSRLLHPSNISGIMSTLKMLFGQPEVIVHSMMSKINSLPALKEDKLETIVDFAVSVQNFCATVDACGLEEYFYNMTFLHQLVNKLPPSIKLSWAQYRLSLPTVNLTSFSNWLYTLAEAASAVTIFEPKQVRADARMVKKNNSFVNAHSEEASSDHHYSAPHCAKGVANSCLVCKGNCQAIAKCQRFLEFPRDSRWATVRDLGLCRRCLHQHKGGCQSKLCGKNGCELKHHELLHNDQRSTQLPSNIFPSDASKPPPNQCQVSTSHTVQNSTEHGCHVHQVTSSHMLFRYLPVVLHGKHQSIETFAFLDDGSELTLLDEELANELQLEGEETQLCLLWTGGAKRREVGSKSVQLEVAARHSSSRRYTMQGVRTVAQLLLPSQTLNFEELSEVYPHLKGLPITSYQDVRPRILIGMKDQHLSLVQKSREGALHEPVAVKTRLGWTICGEGNRDNVANLVHSVFHICECNSPSNDSLHKLMKDYFAIDSLGVAQPKKQLLSVEEEQAQSLLETRTVLKGNRYETGLLWRYDNVRLPDSFPMALRRLQCLRKKMDKDSQLADALNKKITDLVEKGYARKLVDDELSQSFPRTWYLPIFPVMNVNKPGKIRMVWDAAAISHGVSLNSALLKGPDQLCELFTILVQFREGQVALTGDVREMFLQVLMRQEDQQCQRFLWYDEEGTLSVYVLQVMSFGACCSPSSAQYVKNLNAERFRGDYPEAVEVIQKRHYVDDMLVSVATEEEAIKLAQQVKKIHAEGGFEIRNWISNSKRVAEALEEKPTEQKNLDLSPELATEKVLGMWWCTNSDTFTYKVGWNRYGRALLEGQTRPTKRQMLRVLMSVFDPLGLIAQFLMYLKVLLQDVWRSGIGWDDQVDENLFERWQTWLQVLPQIEQISIPRCYSSERYANHGYVELHTFVDASENGIAAACYLRFNHDTAVECSIVAAKTRVAPLKFLSIPRLELQAALIGARLARTVSDALTIRISRQVFWSDSQDVLCWIKSDHRRYSSFVAFRISEILELTEMADWRYVPTDLNVADDGTKWKGLPDLKPGARWFNGPQFLYLPEEHWPRTLKKASTTDLELRPSAMVHCVAPDPIVRVNDFSSWSRLVRVVAFVYRFFYNCRRRHMEESIMSGPLSSQEMKSAEAYLHRQTQLEAYPDEIALLQLSQNEPKLSRTPLPKTSPLHQKSPLLDQNGVLRMRGRIANCDYATEDAKHPVILPRDHPTTRLIIAHFHQKFHHQNHETVINEIRQKYSVPKLRTAFANVRKGCQRCKNHRAIPRVPIMADLPVARLDAFARPFTHVGVDFFGPYEIVIGRRTEKRWGMLATCLTTRAIHIEVAHSLSTDSCVMALRNFISRRGKPRTIHSDRGTNFVGANRKMNEAKLIVDQAELIGEFVDADTSWLFLPPSSPHMGGSWERLIGSVKKNLMAILPTRRLSDEVLRNLLTEVENTVNSRPLTHVPVDDESAPALTPNHFLIGSSNGVKPLCTIDDSGEALRQCWRLSQVQANRFWKRWINDYLPEITRRTKWFTDTKPIQHNDVVVIVDSKLPRNCWPKGRIICTHPGKDGQPRSATVRTTSGIYERPVAKLAVLDVRRVTT
ncbi:uncharacterized protein LOC134287695 [Aedes albopictus]|uniref:Integrase catalytic domain-containing protein n=1 Tax=Aedes albopictus TaxID=7160 RepID=A0ABM1ZPM6_AEDAL